MRLLVPLALAVVAASILIPVDTSHSAFPGRIGEIVFSSNTGENLTAQLFSIRPDGTGRLNLTRNPDANIGAVWSPDGSRITFFQPNVPGSVLVVMNADGSEQRRLTDPLLWASDPAWSPDGTLIAYQQAYRPAAGVRLVRPDGGDDRLVFSGGESGIAPAWSPDGLRLAVVAEREGGQALTLLDTSGGPARDLVLGSSLTNPAWSPDGSSIAYALYTPESGHEIHVVRPDGSGDRLVAKGFRAVWSPDGTRLAVVGDVNLTTLTVMEPDGTGALTVSRRAGDHPSWSPDGRRLAFVRDSRDVYLVDADGSGLRRVTHELAGSRVERPAWSPDGRRILYQAFREQNDAELYVMSAAGKTLRPITDNEAGDTEPAWSPDGGRIAFVRGDVEDGRGGIWVADASGGRARRLTGGLDSSPSWSPDGSRIVFARSWGDRPAFLYVMRDDGSKVRRFAPGADPAWSPDGRSIAFVAGDGLRVMRSSGGRSRIVVSPDDVAPLIGEVEVDFLFAPAWSPDGRRLGFAAYYAYGRNQDFFAAFTVRADGSGLAAPLWGVEPEKLSIDWSPDGRSLLFGAGHVLTAPARGGKPVDLTPLLPGWSSDAAWRPRCSRSGSARADDLRGPPGDDLVCGFEGDDAIDGGAGTDRLFGGPGNDRIAARDGDFDVIGCGAGNDAVRADRIDLVGADCERVERR